MHVDAVHRAAGAVADSLSSSWAQANVCVMAARDSIVVAIDGGRATIHLARVAGDLARVLAAPLDLVHVVGAMPDRGDEAREDALWPPDSQLTIRAGAGPEADARR